MEEALKEIKCNFCGYESIDSTDLLCSLCKNNKDKKPQNMFINRRDACIGNNYDNNSRGRENNQTITNPFNIGNIYKNGSYLGIYTMEGINFLYPTPIIDFGFTFKNCRNKILDKLNSIQNYPEYVQAHQYLYPCTNWGLAVIAIMIQQKLNIEYKSIYEWRTTFNNLTSALVSYVSLSPQKTGFFGDSFQTINNCNSASYKRLSKIFNEKDFMNKFKCSICMKDFKGTMMKMVGLDINVSKDRSKFENYYNHYVKGVEFLKWDFYVRPKMATCLMNINKFYQLIHIYGLEHAMIALNKNEVPGYGWFKKCERKDCNISANFNHKGNGAIFCNNHKEDGMINVNTNKEKKRIYDAMCRAKNKANPDKTEKKRMASIKFRNKNKDNPDYLEKKRMYNEKHRAKNKKRKTESNVN